jgi:hypothetical protein
MYLTRTNVGTTILTRTRWESAGQSSPWPETWRFPLFFYFGDSVGS